MSHTNHHYLHFPLSFTVNHLIGGLLGIALAFCLFFIGATSAATSAAANDLTPGDPTKVSQEEKAFRDLIFDRTNNFWVAEVDESEDANSNDLRELPHVSAPPPSMERPTPDDEQAK
jgi:hypothetical protein